MAEVSGIVYQQTENGKIPMERIYLNIYNEQGLLAAKILSEANGYYSYLGLPPGIFKIRPDAVQLKKLNLQFLETELICIIKSSYNGNTYPNNDFILKKISQLVP